MASATLPTFAVLFSLSLCLGPLGDVRSSLCASSSSSFARIHSDIVLHDRYHCHYLKSLKQWMWQRAVCNLGRVFMVTFRQKGRMRMGQEDGDREKEMKYVWNSILCGRTEDCWRAQAEYKHAPSHLDPYNLLCSRMKARIGKWLGSRWQQRSSSTSEWRILAFVQES